MDDTDSVAPQKRILTGLQRAGLAVHAVLAAALVPAYLLFAPPSRWDDPLAIAVLAVLGLRGRVPAGTVVAVAGATAVFAITTVGWARMRDDRIIDTVGRNPATVTVTTVESLPRVAWRLHDVRWMLVEHGELVAVLDDLHAAGVDRVAVVTGDGIDLAGRTAYPVADEIPDRELNARHGQLVMLSG